MKEQPIRVLLVEDNPGDARLVQETLAEVDTPEFELTHVERLSQARQRLSEERFDVVLLDLVLPDRPRMGSLIEIHDQASRVPIVVLTGLDDETMASWTLEEGAQDYLIKGQTDKESLVRCIRHAIQRHRTQSGRVRTAPAHFA
jgi:two-component system, cell cycle sensor histidine kinase and response regulator CckA